MSDQTVIPNEVSRRYAIALYALARESKALKTIEKDVKTLRGVLSGHADMQRALTAPIFATEDKARALMAVAKKAKVSKLMIQFIGTAAQNQRADEIPAMLVAFEDLAAKDRGTLIAKVTSATKLTASQVGALKSELKKSVLADMGAKSIDIETAIDPDLLGGFVVRIGSRLYDSSLKTQLEDLKLALKEA